MAAFSCGRVWRVKSHKKAESVVGCWKSIVKASWPSKGWDRIKVSDIGLDHQPLQLH